jgi:ATP-binding cassette subfamily B (MDR/TAP) protein 1
MGFKISDFIVLAGRGLGCFIYAMISAWKFSIVFLGIMPFLAACVVLLIIFIKRFTLIELKAYGHAGKVAQEVLSSLRTVLAFGSMKKEVAKYEVNQREAEKMSTKKGLFAGFFIGLALMLFNFCFAIGLFYGVFLARTECDTYEPGDIMKSLFLMITATFSIGQGLPFLNVILY